MMLYSTPLPNAGKAKLFPILYLSTCADDTLPHTLLTPPDTICHLSTHAQPHAHYLTCLLPSLYFLARTGILTFFEVCGAGGRVIMLIVVGIKL